MTYAILAEGRNEQELIQLDLALAPSAEDADAITAKANMEAMKQLQAAVGGLAPPRAR